MLLLSYVGDQSSPSNETTTEKPNETTTEKPTTDPPLTKKNLTEGEKQVQKFELALNPAMKEEQQQQVQRTIDRYNEEFGKLDMEKAYEPLFELLWYSQMPCFDVKGMTSSFKDEISAEGRNY